MSPYRAARNHNCGLDDWDDSDLRNHHREFEYPLHFCLEAVARNDGDSIASENLEEIQDLCDRSRRSSTSCRSLRFLMRRMALATNVREVRCLRDTAGERLRLDRWWRPYGAVFADKLAWIRIQSLRQNPPDPISIENWYREAKFPLLRLPAELRRQVYDLVLPMKGKVVLPLKDMGNLRWGNDGERLECIPHLMLTNHQIRDELQDILYRERLFSLGCFRAGFHFLHHTKWKGTLQELHPKVSAIRHWRVRVGAGHHKDKHFPQDRYPRYLYASDTVQLRESLQKFCDYLLQMRNITTIEIVADEKYNWGCGDFEKARRISDLRPVNWVNEDHEHLNACGHGECAENECVWVPRVSLDLKYNDPGRVIHRRSRLTDLEYVLQPFEQLRELSRVSVTLPRELKRDPHTVAYKYTLETLLTSDCEMDLRITETWAWLIDTARSSLHSAQPQHGAETDAQDVADMDSCLGPPELEIDEVFTGLSNCGLYLTSNASKSHLRPRRLLKKPILGNTAHDVETEVQPCSWGETAWPWTAARKAHTTAPVQV